LNDFEEGSERGEDYGNDLSCYVPSDRPAGASPSDPTSPSTSCGCTATCPDLPNSKGYCGCGSMLSLYQFTCTGTPTAGSVGVVDVDPEPTTVTQVVAETLR
jgi:hypothetical protein